MNLFKRLLSLTFLCLLTCHHVLAKEDFLPTAATTTTTTATAATSEDNSTEEDSVRSGDASHDEAYNAIITNYYTTDPFFGFKSGAIESSIIGSSVNDVTKICEIQGSIKD